MIASDHCRHWTSKDCRAWTKDYLGKTLTQISAEEGGVSAKVTALTSCEGDVDVAMRKRKIITIYDVRIQLRYDGQAGEGDENKATGSITIPEMSYDLGEDDYVFEIDVMGDDGSSKSRTAIKDLVRRKIVPQLRKEFSKFSKVLVDTHGDDVYNKAEDLPKTQTGSVTSSGTATSANTPSAAGTPAKKSSSLVNTTTLAENIEFQAPADELYRVFEDPARLAAWTRAPPVSDFRAGGKYSLFGGNVTGEYLQLEPGKRIVQTWRLQSWTPGHFATLELVLDQGSDYTLMRMKMDGVPIGQEETVTENFNEYYVKPIKMTFGFGAVL